MTPADDRIRRLSARLALIASDADDIAVALEDEPLHVGHLGLLTSPVEHLSIALRNIDNVLWELDVHGESPLRLPTVDERQAA